MAKFDLYFPKEIALEGAAYENVPGDNGGCTKFGLTLDDLKEYKLDSDHNGIFDCNDVKNLTRERLKGTIVVSYKRFRLKKRPFDCVPMRVVANKV